MRSALPAARPMSGDRGARARRTEPVPLGELVGEALSPALQRQLVDLGRIRDVWDLALPAPFAGTLTPEAFERGILRLRASSRDAARRASRARADIRRAVRGALCLPGVKLRVSIRPPRSRPAAGGARRDSGRGAA